MSNSDFLDLVNLVGLLRRTDARPGIKAKVHVVSRDGEHKGEYSVKARIEPGKYETLRRDRYSKLEIIYNSNESKTRISESGSVPDIRDGEWRVPILTPELSMFRPLDFPMWGGPDDSHEIVSVHRQDDNFLLRIAMLGTNGENGTISEMLIDSELGYVQRMNWNDSTYTIVNIEIQPSSNIWDL